MNEYIGNNNNIMYQIKQLMLKVNSAKLALSIDFIAEMHSKLDKIIVSSALQKCNSHEISV